MHDCRVEFNARIEAALGEITQKNKDKSNQISSQELIMLIKNFRHSIYGFGNRNKKNPNDSRSLPSKFKNSKNINEKDKTWLSTSVKRLSTLILYSSKNNSLENHFIFYLTANGNNSNNSNDNGDVKVNVSNVGEWKFEILSLISILIDYLENIDDSQNNKKTQIEHSIITIVWTLVDCSKWKYFESIGLDQQNAIKLICFQLLKSIFCQTNLLSTMRNIFINHVCTQLVVLIVYGVVFDLILNSMTDNCFYFCFC